MKKVKERRIKFEKTACRCSGKLFFPFHCFYMIFHYLFAQHHQKSLNFQKYRKTQWKTMDFEPPKRRQEVKDCWRGRQDCRKTACRCSGKLSFQNNSFMHQFSQKRKTAPRCSGQLFLGGPRGEKRVPKIEIIVVKRWVDCEDTQRKECAKAMWSCTRMAVQRSMKAKSVSWKTASRYRGRLFFGFTPAPMDRCVWQSYVAVLRPTCCKGYFKLFFKSY